MTLIIIFITTFTASLLSSMSGGGTAIINIPVFLSLGFSVPLSLAIISLNNAFWVLPASFNYLKGRKIDWKFIFIFSLLGLVGTYFSIKFILGLDKRTYQLIAGPLILVLVTYTYFKKNLGLTEEKVYSKTRQTLAYPFALILGFWENAFAAGNGVMFSLMSFYTKGFDFISALGHYYAIAFPWCVVGAYLLISKGYFDIKIMPVAILGAVIGAYTGSKYARYKGNKFVKMIFVIIGTILGLKLLLGI
jgi:uncharacterized membrane protein YfcA